MNPSIGTNVRLGVLAALVAAVMLAPIAMATAVAAAELVGPARVEVDASLTIHSRTVRLAGIYVPPTSRFCRTFVSPTRCSSRAALALDFHIGSRMVRCDLLGRSADGGLVGVCWLSGRSAYQTEDLAEWLISRGWALAGPDAPFEYYARERIARAQGRGVWGFTVDEID